MIHEALHILALNWLATMGKLRLFAIRGRGGEDCDMLE